MHPPTWRPTKLYQVTLEYQTMLKICSSIFRPQMTNEFIFVPRCTNNKCTEEIHRLKQKILQKRNTRICKKRPQWRRRGSKPKCRQKRSMRGFQRKRASALIQPVGQEDRVTTLACKLWIQHRVSKNQCIKASVTHLTTRAMTVCSISCCWRYFSSSSSND